MQLTTEIFGDVLVVHAPDELDEEHVEEFHRFLSRQGRVKVRVDLDSVEAIDSAGLAACLEVQEQFRASQGDLKLIAGNPINRKILEITRLDEQLEVFESVIDAVKSFA